jgi:hypothetical protein
MFVSDKSHAKLPLISVLLILFLGLSVSLAACAGSRGERESAMPDADSQSPPNVSLAAIKSAAQNYQDKIVTISGVFKGWKGLCRSSFTVTRSDWILDDGTDCIYVSGQIPTGVSATEPKDERLVVTGTILRDKAGAIHLKAMEINRTPGMTPQ